MSDLFERLDPAFEETMAAYVAAAEYLETGDQVAHADELRRALRLSAAYHAEADLVDAIVLSRVDGAA